jgi:hypothetical protein
MVAKVDLNESDNLEHWIKENYLFVVLSFKTKGALGQFKPPIRVGSGVPVASVLFSFLDTNIGPRMSRFERFYCLKMA